MTKRSAFSYFTILLALAAFTLNCSAQPSEEQALRNLREMTRGGKLPPESVVADIETRFANKKTGALAKLLRARIKYEAGDYAGSAALLNSDVFAKRTKIADHAMFLRAQALHKSGSHAGAMRLLFELMELEGKTVRIREARLLWAESAIAIGQAVRVPPMLVEMIEKGDQEAAFVAAKAYEAQGSTSEAIQYYRRAAYVAPSTNRAAEATNRISQLGASPEPTNAAEQLMFADGHFATRKFTDAALAYAALVAVYPSSVTPAVRLRQLTAVAGSGNVVNLRSIFDSLPSVAPEREEGYRQLALGYAKAKQWPQARTAVDEMRQRFPSSRLLAKSMIDVGMAARDAKNNAEARYYFDTAVVAYPNAVEVAQAQFESAWLQHEAKNYTLSSQMLTDHLARYADKDTSNRGKAGYWAARDSERAGKNADACAIYAGVMYRYGANWYGYQAEQRLSAMRNSGRCSTSQVTPAVEQAVANLKTVTVAAETAREAELDRAEKSEELSTVGLFDWAIDELNEAKKTAGNSPKINLALAQHYTLKGDRVNALLALAKSYPDYAQMFPEEMGREEWAIFYPLTNWNEISQWSRARGLDRYQVAGVIRQETIFDPVAKSHANAYGLMQLLLPTAKSMARKYSASQMPNSAVDLFQPALNIELGTAYMKDQFAKFGRFEYVGIAYNAGPGRVAPWRAQLPLEMDEFVEAIPFKETKGYVQGIVRNTAQYRRLYDDNGNFRPNVGSKSLRGEIDSKPREQFTAEYPEVKIDDNAK